MNPRIYVYTAIGIAITAIIAISVLFSTVFEPKTTCCPVRGSYDHVSPRVVGGGFAKSGEYPYLVSLQIYRKHFCGGSLISSRHVLTAAHCIIFRHREIKVVVGTIALPGDTAYETDRATVHYAYNPPSLRNDIAIIRLKRRVRQSENVSTIDLPSPRQFYYDKMLYVVGFGRTRNGGTSSPFLKKLVTSVCSCPYMVRHPGRFCACTKADVSGACHGDSGGPVTIISGRKILIGVISAVTVIDDIPGVGPCASGSPDIIISVQYYLDWIKRHMK